MSELLRLGQHCLYLPGVVNVGVVHSATGDCLLIDSGTDKDHAKKILSACEALGLLPRAIINTHSHADHYGGNAYLQNKLGIPAYCPIFEEAILRYPILEPLYLYGGARPPKELQSKWLMGQPSNSIVLDVPGPTTIAGIALELIDVGGHAPAMFAVRVGDVLFATDAVFGPQVLQKYPLQFAADIARQTDAVKAIAMYATSRGVRVVLPGHGEPTETVAELCDANLAAIDRASDAVLAACSDPASLQDILVRVCVMLNIQMTDLARFHLNQTTVLAHLTRHVEAGRLRYELQDNRLLWQFA